MKSNTGPSALADAEWRRLRASPTLRRLPGRNWTKADIEVRQWQGAPVAIKDYAHRPFWVRQTLGRWLVGREVAAYRAAAGIVGLPRLIGRSRFALVTEWIEARPLAAWAPGTVPPGWEERLRSIVSALHARGVALGDLHHRDVLVSPEGAVHVVDLAAAWWLGPRPGALRRWIFERLRDQDRVALARMSARQEGRDVDAAVETTGARAATWHRRGRRLKRWIRRWTGASRA